MGNLPTLPRLAALGFQGDLLGDSDFKGAPFATAALAYDIPRLGPARRNAGRAFPAQRDQVGGGAPFHLVEPLPAAQHLLAVGGLAVSQPMIHPGNPGYNQQMILKLAHTPRTG